MSVVEVVENPRKKRRRMTAKQRKYFGPRRRRATRKAAPRRRRRRNPSLAMIGNPRPRRRARRTVRGYVVKRRRRNPGLGGLFGTVDLMSVMFVAGGALGVKVLPGMVAQWFPALPVYGPMGMLVRAGTVLVLGMGTRFITKSKQRATQVVTGGLAILAIEAWDTYVAPMIGLGQYASGSEINSVLGNFIPTPRGLGKFVPTPRGLGAMVDTPDMELAA